MVLLYVARHQLMSPLLILLLPVRTDTMNILPNPGYKLFSLTENEKSRLCWKSQNRNRVLFPGQRNELFQLPWLTS
jgi:hypothetical protein